jgi:beta-glucosidase
LVSSEAAAKAVVYHSPELLYNVGTELTLERYGTYSTVESLEAGLDIEMPGPTRWRGQMLLHALMSRKIDMEVINERVRQVLKLVHRAVQTGIPENAPEQARDTPETASLLRTIASEAIVLLKNENNALPFKKDKKVRQT